MTWVRRVGTHTHLADNISDFADAVEAVGVTGVPDGGTTGQALVKDSGSDGDASWHNIEALATAETDDTLVLRPDGAGGVEFVAPAAGASGVTAVRTYISFGVNMSGQSYTP